MISLITDPVFDINRTEEYILSIQVSLDGFSFSVIHLHDKRLLASGQFPITVSSENFLGRRFTEWYNEVEMLQKKYSEIQLYYYSEKFTLVPSSFYEFNKQNKIIEKAFGKLNGNSVRDNFFPEDKANLIFTIPDSLKEAFDKKFPGYIILHPLLLLSKKLHQNFLIGKNERLLALSFQNNSFSLLLYYKNKLQVSNTFCYKHPNDVIFYLLSVLKSRKINHSKTTLLLSGKISPNSELASVLSIYFAQTEFLKISAQYNENIFREHTQQLTPLL
jgi:hypothetical protein